MIEILAPLITEDWMRGMMNKILDHVERNVEKTDNSMDDAVVLPITRAIRDAYLTGTGAVKIGFVDKNGIDILLDDACRTYDSTGKEWIGRIVRVDPCVLTVGSDKLKYAFKSNYETWINNQEYASTLEILDTDAVVEEPEPKKKETLRDLDL
jgi:hypothetical protein